MRLFTTAVLTLFCTLYGYGQSTSTSGSRDTQEFQKKVDAYIKPFVEIKGFSGAILIARRGEVLIRKGYGMANYELDAPNTPQTKFHIASISKDFTAAAILLLEERGVISVNDTLDKYIPDYPKGNSITIQHLLVHTSGIPNVNNLPDYDSKSRFPISLNAVIDMFKYTPLEGPPGQRYSYSNSNYNLLALIIEKASGMSYGDFLKANIFDPLGMNDTAHDGKPGVIVSNRASGYAPVGFGELENAPALDWSIKTGNGSLYSTVDDLYQWDRALYGDKLLQRATLERIFTEQVPGIGYGWSISQRGNRKLVSTSGRSPGFQGEIQRYIGDEVCLIVLSNNYSGAASFIINGLAGMLFGVPYVSISDEPSKKLDPTTIAAFAGHYQGESNFVIPGASLTVQAQNGYLSLTWSTTPELSWLVPMNESRFYDRNFGATVTFVKDENGKVSHLVYGMLGRDYRAIRRQ
jgi:CubicO group peptidase (beta-lactamase class C family)